MQINLVGGPMNGESVVTNAEHPYPTFTCRDKPPAPDSRYLSGDMPMEPLMCREYTYLLRYTLDNIPFYQYDG